MSAETNAPPYRWAGATFLVILAIYFVTLAPTTAFWDTSEYIAAAKVLGIPHPPGNPLFTLLAHVWGLLPLSSEYAKRINLFAAATSAGGAAIWFLVAARWLRDLLPARGPRLAAAFAGVFASATAWTVWNQSVVNEKVYTVSLLTIAFVVWCAVHWADQPEGERRDRWIVLAVYISMLSSTNHQMGILGLPVVAWYVLATDWRVILRWRVVVAVIAVALLGISLHHIYLPIRAAQFPPINEGEPIGFGSQALQDVLNRVQYGKPPITHRMSPLGAQLTHYWTYWNWQWGRDLGGLQGIATALFTLLGLGGLYALLRRNWRSGLAATGLLVTVTLLLIYYLNFKYGFSYHIDDAAITGEMREVRERDYFFIVSFAFVGVLFAAGFAALIRVIGEALEPRVTDARRWIVGTPVLLLGLVPLVGNRITAPRNNETLARDFAIDMLQSIAPYGILITKGDNDTFPLWFAQEVLGVRRDVTLANLSLMNTDWHLRQLRRRVIPPFDLATAPAIWRPGTDSPVTALGGAPPSGWPQPTAPVFNRSDGWLDSLPAGARVTQGEIHMVGNVKLTFGAQVFSRSDLAVFTLITDNLGKRPIYFSWSDGGYPDETFGLTPYLVTQGMVRLLMPDSVKLGGDIVEGDMGLTDYPGNKALLFGTYHPEAAMRTRAMGWVDPPSGIILQLYWAVYGSGTPLFLARGDSALAGQAITISRAIQKSIPKFMGR